MQIKRYEVSNVQEAISKIKNELGPDAIILSTKKLKPAGKNKLEVLAARDLDVTALGQNTISVKSDSNNEFIDNTHNEDLASVLKDNFEELKKFFRDLKTDQELRIELAEVKDSMNTFFDVLGLKSNKTENDISNKIYFSLISKGISKEKAWKLVEKVKRESVFGKIENSEEGLIAVENLIRQSIPAVSNSNKGRRVKVIIGPTGVGKTTTLAKLSAYHAITEKENVGLITTDTYRIAAVEQLKIYAKIIGIPLEIAQGNEEFKESLRKFGDKDVIFVDTPGTSRKDMVSLNKLNETLKSEIPFESNLLLSLTSSKECMVDTALRYNIFDYDRVILTKADECISVGFLWEVLDRIGKPVSYITNGQNVPYDIEEANPHKIAKMIMGNAVN